MEYSIANLSHSPRLTVLIAPERFDASRLTIPECSSIVSSCQVRARGWYYPHINRDRTKAGPRGIYAFDETDSGDHLEQWRMYRSGQFMSRMVPWEVFNERVQDNMRQNSRPWNSRFDIDKLPGMLSFVMLILSVSEAYLFAARLAQAARYDTDVTLQVALRDLQGWALGSNDFGVHLNGIYIAESTRLESARTVSLDQLIAAPLDSAIVSIQELFQQFGWSTIADATIRTWQLKYLRV